MPELEELVQSLYGCEMKVVHVDHGKEPLILLSHLSNEVVYEKGFRNQQDTAEYVLYRIRIDAKYGTIRSCNVSPPVTHLAKSDSYFIIQNNRASLIKGSEISSSVISNLYKLCEKILCRRKLSDTTITTIDASAPLDEFPIFKRSGLSFNYFNHALFFRCSCALGYYSIEHLGAFSQEDLRPDCVVILDCSPGLFFMWIGNEASDVVTQLTLKAIDLKKTRNDGKADCKPITIEQGKEPQDFIMYFNVWEDESELEPTNSYLSKMKELSL